MITLTSEPAQAERQMANMMSELPGELARFEELLLRLSRESQASGKRLATLGVTSSRAGEGVSTVAAGLAIAASGMGKEVLLVQWDPRGDASADDDEEREQSEETLRVGSWRELEPVRACINAQQTTGLSLLLPPAAARLASGADDERRRWLQDAAERFDLTVFDLPPVSDSALRLAPLVDGVLLVVEAERVRSEVAAWAAEQLRAARTNVVGVVLNKQRQHVPDWLYRRL